MLDGFLLGLPNKNVLIAAMYAWRKLSVGNIPVVTSKRKISIRAMTSYAALLQVKTAEVFSQ